MSWKRSSDNRLMEWIGGKFNFIVFLNRDEEICCAMSLTDQAKKEIRIAITAEKLEEIASETTVLVRDMMIEMVGLMDVEIMKEVMGA